MNFTDDFFGSRWDAEYQRYRLMAQIQKVQDCLKNRQLYPWFPEHLSVLHTVSTMLNQIHQHYKPKKLTGIDLDNYALKYEQERNDVYEEEFVEILKWYHKSYHWSVEQGLEARQKFLEAINIQQIGIQPLYQTEGYIFLEQEDLAVFRYALIYQSRDSHGDGVKTNWVFSLPKAEFPNPESVKRYLIKTDPTLPNPATWMVTVSEELPLNETLVPLACSLLEKKLKEF